MRFDSKILWTWKEEIPDFLSQNTFSDCSVGLLTNFEPFWYDRIFKKFLTPLRQAIFSRYMRPIFYFQVRMIRQFFPGIHMKNALRIKIYLNLLIFNRIINFKAFKICKGNGCKIWRWTRPFQKRVSKLIFIKYWINKTT